MRLLQLWVPLRKSEKPFDLEGFVNSARCESPGLSITATSTKLARLPRVFELGIWVRILDALSFGQVAMQMNFAFILAWP